MQDKATLTVTIHYKLRDLAREKGGWMFTVAWKLTLIMAIIFHSLCCVPIIIGAALIWLGVLPWHGLQIANRQFLHALEMCP